MPVMTPSAGEGLSASSSSGRSPLCAASSPELLEGARVEEQLQPRAGVELALRLLPLDALLAAHLELLCAQLVQLLHALTHRLRHAPSRHIPADRGAPYASAVPRGRARRTSRNSRDRPGRGGCRKGYTSDVRFASAPALLLVAGLLACSNPPPPPPAAAPGPLRAGVAVVAIDVPIGTPSGGFGRSRPDSDPGSPWAQTLPREHGTPPDARRAGARVERRPEDGRAGQRGPSPGDGVLARARAGTPGGGNSARALGHAQPRRAGEVFHADLPRPAARRRTSPPWRWTPIGGAGGPDRAVDCSGRT